MKLRDTLRNAIDSIIPRPKSVKPAPGAFVLDPGLVLAASGEAQPVALQMQGRWKKSLGLAAEIESSAPRGRRTILFELTAEKFDKAVPRNCTEAYQIVIGKSAVRLRGNTPAGLYYAAVTFEGLVVKMDEGPLAPCLTLTDWPQFP